MKLCNLQCSICRFFLVVSLNISQDEPPSFSHDCSVGKKGSFYEAGEWSSLINRVIDGRSSLNPTGSLLRSQWMMDC